MVGRARRPPRAGPTPPQLFGQYGQVDSARIIREKGTRVSLGYGFVRFRQPEDAQRAILGLNGARVENKVLKVCCRATGRVGVATERERERERHRREEEGGGGTGRQERTFGRRPREVPHADRVRALGVWRGLPVGSGCNRPAPGRGAEHERVRVWPRAVHGVCRPARPLSSVWARGRSPRPPRYVRRVAQPDGATASVRPRRSRVCVSVGLSPAPDAPQIR